MTTLIIIRGLPGSGKSTLANQLLDAYDFCTNLNAPMLLHFEADMFFGECETYKFIPSQLGEAHDWCQRKVRDACKEGIDVVVSNTFSQRWEIQPYLDMAKAYNYDVQILECKGSFPNVHGVPQATIDKMKARWESI